MKKLILRTGNHDAGFTLLEILIIMVIIGIVLAVLTPNFNNYLQSIEVKADQRKLLNLLGLARIKAIISGEEKVVEIKEGHLLILKPQENNEDLRVKTTSLRLIEGPELVLFYPDGTSSGGSLIFTYQDTRKVLLKINQLTGKPLWDDAN